MVIPFITPYVLESPRPLALMLVLGGAATCWIALRSNRNSLLWGGLAGAMLGILVYVIGRIVETPGEHASAIAHQLIDAAMKNDYTGIDALLAPQATLSLVSESNLGIDHDSILELTERRLHQVSLASNFIGGESIVTNDASSGSVTLTCRTIVDGVPYPVLSKWKLRVQQQEDGHWLVTRIVCLSINNQAPSSLLGH